MEVAYAITAVIMFFMLIGGGVIWILDRPPRIKDPKEDQEQMEYFMVVGMNEERNMERESKKMWMVLKYGNAQK